MVGGCLEVLNLSIEDLNTYLSRWRELKAKCYDSLGW